MVLKSLFTLDLRQFHPQSFRSGMHILELQVSHSFLAYSLNPCYPLTIDKVTLKGFVGSRDLRRNLFQKESSLHPIKLSN